MSLKLERWMRGLVNGQYGRWVMLGLLIAILSGFTVMSEIGDWLFGRGQTNAKADIAGSFAVLPGDVTRVRYDEFGAARRRLGVAQEFLLGTPRDRVSEMDVWTHLVLLGAAKREQIVVSADDLREAISRVVPDYMIQDKAQYRRLIQERFGVSAPVLESAILEYLTAIRVREIYAESYIVGPATTRKAAVEQAASQNVEYALGDYAALDVARFLPEAEAELSSESDPDSKLREFFDKDPSLALDPERFRHPRRFRLEVLYTIHSNVDTAEKIARITDLVGKAYPEAKFPEPTIKERHTYYGTYTNRLLATAGQTMASVTKTVREKQASETPSQDKEPKKEDGKPEEAKPENGDGEKPGETAPDGEKPDEAKPEGEQPEGEKPAGEMDDGDKPDGDKPDGDKPDGDKPADKDEPPLTADLREKINEYGYQIVKEQVAREITVRSVYEFLHQQTKDNVSLKELFDKLKAHDDAENPICSTEAGKGLIVYRDFDGNPLTSEELQEIEDSGVKFGFSFRPRVSNLGETDLPKMSRKADTLGDEGHGRQIFRLLEVIREQRKTYDELTAGEKEELRKLFYLPARARARASEKLETLRKALVSGEVKPEQFRARAEELGCRVHEDEWITASYETVREPDPKRLWPDEYLHMRDRHFLRRSLAQVLERDRAKPEGKEEWNPPCFLPVDVDTRGGTKEPGSVYLFHLRERKRPDATTITESELSLYLKNFVNRRAYEDRERWTSDPEQLKTDFNMVFDKEMQTQVDEDMARRKESRGKGMRR